MIVNFAPQSLAEEVDQNIRCILETVAGTVPFFRSFGLDTIGTDLPTAFYESQMTNKIITAIQEFEPRAIVDSVTYVSGEDGKLNPNVKYHLQEGGGT